jgi:hypothetical protein
MYIALHGKSHTKTLHTLAAYLAQNDSVTGH